MIIEQKIKDHVYSEILLFHELLFKKIMESLSFNGNGEIDVDAISSVKDYCSSVLKKSLSNEIDDEIKNNYIEVKLYNISGKEYMIDMEHGMVFSGKRVDIVDVLKKQLLEKLKLHGSSVLNEEKDLFK